jgi:hypothetical protein
MKNGLKNATINHSCQDDPTETRPNRNTTQPASFHDNKIDDGVNLQQKTYD